MKFCRPCFVWIIFGGPIGYDSRVLRFSLTSCCGQKLPSKVRTVEESCRLACTLLERETVLYQYYMQGLGEESRGMFALDVIACVHQTTNRNRCS